MCRAVGVAEPSGAHYVPPPGPHLMMRYPVRRLHPVILGSNDSNTS